MTNDAVNTITYDGNGLRVKKVAGTVYNISTSEQRTRIMSAAC